MYPPASPPLSKSQLLPCKVDNGKGTPFIGMTETSMHMRQLTFWYEN